MSLKIKSISYCDVSINNTVELKQFYNDIKTLIIKGYSISIEVFAHNNSNTTQLSCGDTDCSSFSPYIPAAATSTLRSNDSPKCFSYYHPTPAASTSINDGSSAV